jgi:hypothetical protein
MNFILGRQKNPTLASLVHSRARQVMSEVRHWVELSQRSYHGQTGYFQWQAVNGQAWGVFEEGRCQWLLVIEDPHEKVLYYRQRRDLDHYQIHETGHGGTLICQTVEQLGQVTKDYRCETSCNRQALDRKLRWFNLQRWLHSVRQQVRCFQGKAA